MMLRATLATLLLFIGITSSGCDQKEKVLDVETPGGSIEINKDKDSGEVEIDVDEK